MKSKSTEHRRGRKPMTEAEKEQARAKRASALVAREVAVNAINSNDQFLDHRTWAALAPDVLDGIKAAIGKVGDRARKAQIANLRKQLEKLEQAGA